MPQFLADLLDGAKAQLEVFKFEERAANKEQHLEVLNHQLEAVQIQQLEQQAGGTSTAPLPAPELEDTA